MQKPLGEKTLEKKYAELGLSNERLALLHRYFRAFSNLYGELPVQNAWEIFRQYEGTTYIHKKDFVAFAGVVQREAGLPYHVIDINEIYSAEEPEPEWRMIVHDDLIAHGQHRFYSIYTIEEKKRDYTVFMPEKKEELLVFEEEQFYKTPEGKAMVAFVNSLTSSGIGIKWDGTEYALADVNGQSVKGKRLDSFIMLNQLEQVDVEYEKRDAMKQRLLQKYTVNSAEKILKIIKQDTLEGMILKDISPITFVLDQLVHYYGVKMSIKQVEKFAQLYMDLNNSSHMWQSFGWSPNNLRKKYGLQYPSAVSIGPGMKKMIKNGELDAEELRKKFAEMGIEMEL